VGAADCGLRAAMTWRISHRLTIGARAARYLALASGFQQRVARCATRRCACLLGPRSSLTANSIGHRMPDDRDATRHVAAVLLPRTGLDALGGFRALVNPIGNREGAFR